MTEGQEINGQCLCGAVTVRARVTKPILRACHCDMCRRHTSGMFISLPTDPASQQVDGPAKSFRSSEWAERGFCELCGSTLWYRTIEDNQRQLAAGLFDNAGGAKMRFEFFADRCPQGYALSGDHRRMSTEETLAMFTRGGE
ncbi:MAG: GFA family protein [Arenibacterium sp.]